MPTVSKILAPRDNAHRFPNFLNWYFAVIGLGLQRHLHCKSQEALELEAAQWVYGIMEYQKKLNQWIAYQPYYSEVPCSSWYFAVIRLGLQRHLHCKSQEALEPWGRTVGVWSHGIPEKVKLPWWVSGWRGSASLFRGTVVYRFKEVVGKSKNLAKIKNLT